MSRAGGPPPAPSQVRHDRLAARQAAAGRRRARRDRGRRPGLEVAGFGPRPGGGRQPARQGGRRCSPTCTCARTRCSSSASASARARLLPVAHRRQRRGPQGRAGRAVGLPGEPSWSWPWRATTSRSSRRIPGIGKKLAQRLVVELKDKVGTLPPVRRRRGRRAPPPAPSCRRARRCRTSACRCARPKRRCAARPPDAPLEELSSSP